MKKILPLIILLAALTAFLLPTAPALAATEYTVTISEARINQMARNMRAEFPDVKNFYFEVQEGRLGVVETFVVNGTEATAIIGVVPSIQNGLIVWTTTGFSVNGAYFDPAVFNDGSYSDAINHDLIRPFTYARYGNNIHFNSITLSNHTITIKLAYGPVTNTTTANNNTQPSQPSAPTGCTVTASTDLRLRAAPNTTSAVLTVVPAGTKLAAITTQGNWVQVNYQNQVGWLSLTYVRKTGC